MEQYRNLLKTIYENGRVKSDRTGVGTVSIFGHQMRFDLSKGFPLVTMKQTFVKGVVAELLWMIKGDTNAQTLIDQGVHIWDEWMVPEDIVEEVPLEGYERVSLYCQKTGNGVSETVKRLSEMDFRALQDDPMSSKTGAEFLDSQDIPRTKTIVKVKKGSLGPVYGHQWRHWPNYRTGGTIDQLAEAIDLLKNKPTSRRIIVSAWNPADNPDESVPPHVNAANGYAALNSCHSFFQFMAEPLTLAERMKHDGTKLLFFPVEGSALGDIFKDQGHGAYVDEVIKMFTEQDVDYVTDALDFRNVPRYRLSCQLYQRKRDCALAA